MGLEELDDLKEFLSMAVVTTEMTWKRYKQEILPALKKANQQFLQKYQKEGYKYSFESDLDQLTFKQVTTVLTGKQDNCVGYEDSFRFIKNFSKASFVVVDGAGHNLQIEKTKIFNSAILDWLERISNVQ